MVTARPLMTLSTLILLLVTGSTHAVTIDWVTVGNPDNDGQTQTYDEGAR